ncbi:hypothetical protein EST38_g9217 [Candolleomyces aberdarensis]|uniref:Uncharacterized protein n=1 Tax=Candolleomyces aberdarensis TaxID=2316362 RepID=A0A4Q2DAH5_9AGAR|nr:hypothetical protein EST38_g9217 [Candolleomyces aberdarensis]
MQKQDLYRRRSVTDLESSGYDTADGGYGGEDDEEYDELPTRRHKSKPAKWKSKMLIAFKAHPYKGPTWPISQIL